MGILKYKIWYDLWVNKARTLQVVLIIAMGAAALGVIVGSRQLVIGKMTELWEASSPAMITLWMNPAVDDQTVASLARIEGIEAIEGYNQATIAWRRTSQDNWRTATLIARDDYQQQEAIKISVLDGEFPHGDRIAVGQGADSVFGIGIGDEIEIRINDEEKSIRLESILYDPIAQPPSFGGSAQFFTSRERFRELTGSQDFNRLLVRAAEYDAAQLNELVGEIENKLDRQQVNSGGFLPPFGSRTADPSRHFFQDIMDAVFLILAVMALLSLCLGLFLVYNTIEATISRQIDQIGIMKAIGARSRQIFLSYLTTIFAYGLLALLIALPIGIIGSWYLNVFLLGNFNADPGSFRVSWLAVLIQVAIALVAPLVAAMGPIIAGVRITVREAIGSYGLEAKTGWLEDTLSRLAFLPRLFILTIGNTFRHKGRLILTQITLVFSGLIFMVVMGVRDSTLYTFDDILRSMNRYDLFMIFENPERIEHTEQLAATQPEVAIAEMWYRGGATIRSADEPDASAGRSISIVGLPAASQLYAPEMRGGIWLDEDNPRGIVLNERVAQASGLEIGQWVTMAHGEDKESTWQIVGLLFDPNNIASVHVPRDVFLREIGSFDKANRIYVQANLAEVANDAAAEKQLQDYFAEQGIALSPGGRTITEIAENVIGQFQIIITLLAIMAVVIAVVGSIALSGILSLNVIDRRREIGVMRAIGASARDVSFLFVGQGIILGWLSWLIALPFVIPLTKLATNGLGAIVQANMVFQFTPTGILAWFGIVTVLAIVASYLPSRQAIRTSVQDSLAYQ
ncbi:MAG: FtsX-like permease family protein [Ardenticatenaceae bacterium]|nr:FtsX-like permease family protein [Ardenticatenaceae bacterium]